MNKIQLKYKIGRLVTSKLNPNFAKILIKLNKILSEGNAHIRYFLFPGGFIKIHDLERNFTLEDFEYLIEDNISELISTIPSRILKELSRRLTFISIGIDSIFDLKNGNTFRPIQSVVLYNLKTNEIVHITGKSHPTPRESQLKMKKYPLDSHFYNYYSDKVLILGCHDIKMFSNRASSQARDERLERIKAFRKKVKQFKPNVILHHPHQTDDYLTWNQEWRLLEREDYSFTSSIYYPSQESVDIAKIIHKSQSEDVFTLRY